MTNRTLTISESALNLLHRLVNNLIDMNIEHANGVHLMQLEKDLTDARTVRTGYVNSPCSWAVGLKNDFAFFYGRDDKVPAIKTLREIFGVGLKEAKDMADAAIFNGSANAYKLILKDMADSLSENMASNLKEKARFTQSNRYKPYLLAFRDDVSDDSLVLPLN